MTPAALNRLIVQPVLAELDWPQVEERAVLLIAIAVQESGLKSRRQVPYGPASSWWQIEPATCLDCLGRCKPVRDLWADLGLKRYEVLEFSDIGACAIAAGILRLTPGKLPELGDERAAWDYYLKAWRPGKPGPAWWPVSYEMAMGAVPHEPLP